MSLHTRLLSLVCVAWLCACQGGPDEAPAATAAAPEPPPAAPSAPVAEAPPAPAPEPPPVAEDFEAEAEATIRADNYAAELDALDSEISADSPR